LIDYNQHLDATDILLQQLRDAAKRGDTSKVVELAQKVDWEVVASEFEPAAGRYRNAVYRHGRRIMRNLRRPYMLYHDCVNLDLKIEMLRGTIEDSPSLLATAGKALDQAYQSVLRREVLRGHKKPDSPDYRSATSPWPTIETLIEAANAKIQRGRELEASGNADYNNCRRIYSEHTIPPKPQSILINNQTEQVISMSDVHRTGKVFLDRIANGEQGKFFITHNNKPVYAIQPIGGDMNLIHANQVISATELQRKGKELLSRLKNSGQARFLIIRKNKPIGVLMPINNECGTMMDIDLYPIEAACNQLK